MVGLAAALEQCPSGDDSGYQVWGQEGQHPEGTVIAEPADSHHRNDRSNDRRTTPHHDGDEGVVGGRWCWCRSGGLSRLRWTDADEKRDPEGENTNEHETDQTLAPADSVPQSQPDVGQDREYRSDDASDDASISWLHSTAGWIAPGRRRVSAAKCSQQPLSCGRGHWCCHNSLQLVFPRFAPRYGFGLYRSAVADHYRSNAPLP